MVEQEQIDLLKNIFAGSICTAFSVSVFHPLDTIRIRWQVKNEKFVKSKNIYQFGKSIIEKEGLVRGLWFPGCFAHASSVALSSGFRLGFYPTVRNWLAGNETKNAFHMWFAGFSAGAVGFFLANPLFQTKVRLQAIAGSENKSVRSTTDCLQQIWRKEGLSGLYRGSSTLLVRGAFLSAGAQLGYDYTKTEAKKLKLLNEGPVLHFVASVASAFLASVFSAPCDLIMTKYQAGPILGIKYKSILDCVKIVYRQDGFFGFYRGWSPLFVRLVPLWAFNMPLYEQARRLMGLDYLD